MFSFNLIKKSFVRQSATNDCGTACLSMILNFTGRANEVPFIAETTTIRENGLSLLELKTVAEGFKLPCRCVQMEVSFLRDVSSPCILHMVNDKGENHFQVCYGSRNRRNKISYLMADPAKQVYYLSAEQLEKKWISKAALYFSELHEDLNAFEKSPLISLLSIKFFPAGLWVSVPLITICTAFLGIGFTWVLQKGLSDSMILKEGNVTVEITVLLLIISIFKSIFSFVRQYILIGINMGVNRHLMFSYIGNLLNGVSLNKKGINQNAFKNDMSDIQKIQNAVSIFIATLLSDGSLIIIMTAATFYLFPVAGIINMIYLGIVGFITIKQLPSISYNNASLKELSGTTENYILKDLERIPKDLGNTDIGEKVEFHKGNHNRHLLFARYFAISISKITLLNECLGTLNVITIFAIGLIRINRDNIDYSSFMIVVILSYLVTALLPKICNAFLVMAEGAEASIQYRARVNVP
jgi:ATP-binding cassette, subfamily C, bacteriocin exporter